nr:alpha-L-fucosidase [Clostridiales bacterium]
IKEYVEAFRAEGLRVGFYYSLLDWHHPDYTVDRYHPRRDDGDIAEMNKGRDMKRYAKYMRDQVTELLTNYGKIDILWFDFSFEDKGKNEWEAEKLISTARSIQPDIIIDNRTGIDQDIYTPEQSEVREWVRDKDGNRVVWELCQTFSGSWGYHRDESSWLSPETLVRMLVNCVSNGGNLLLNVGPTSRGYIDARAVSTLEAIGKWMKYNSRSIYGCTESDFKPYKDVRYTQNGDRLYVHLFAYPARSVYLPDLAGKIEYAQFLHDGSELKFDEDDNGGVEVYVPRVKPDQLVPVIELFLKD